MPRYSVRIFSTSNPRGGKSRYVYALDQHEAEGHARAWLNVVRHTQRAYAGLNRWTVSAKLSPHHAPEIVASGGIDGT